MDQSSLMQILEEDIQIGVGSDSIEGNLVVPASAAGCVLFAHGSGSSRFSRRNRFVAERLQERGLATLLVDLLTAREERVDTATMAYRFNIDLLASRLLRVTEWLAKDNELATLPIGYFGASTGAAAALMAAAQRPEVAAIVSRGGRPDLAGASIRQVRANTLLIVGGLDYQVIELNRVAFEKLERAAAKRLEIIPGATHLFEEPGTLEKVAELAGEWLIQHLTSSRSADMARRTN
jgi:dienelactone hydrolase